MPWFPAELKKTILMIGEESGKHEVTPKGSATLIQYKNALYVVTARHLINELRDPVMIFNNKEGKPIGRVTSELTEKMGSKWINHPNPHIDISVIKFDVYSNDDLKSIGEEYLCDFQKVSDGEDIFFMGFPLSLSSRQKITPVVRQGCIALKFDEETKINEVTYPEKSIIIDGQVSGGNSGSPIFRKPSFVDMETRTIGTFVPPVFIGIVTSHIASIIKDLNERPIARENSGLGIVSSTNQIIDLIDSVE